jgi:hypothetical protein
MHMQKKTNSILLLLCCNLTFSAPFLFSQHNIPVFNFHDTTLAIPMFLPGIMADSGDGVLLRSDTLLYGVNGQMFGKTGYKITSNKSTTSEASPWITIFEMANAYAKKNRAGIIALYSSDSKDKINELLASNQAHSILDVFSKAALSNLRLLGGFKYNEGIIAYTEDDVYGVHENYLVQEGGTYRLSALEDKGSKAWNVALYFKFKPEPMLPLHLEIPDSLKISATVTIKVPKLGPKSWIVVYTNKVGGPVTLLIQDNGVNDKNAALGQVTFTLTGEDFINEGIYEVYVSSFNYPVQRISTSMITGQAMHPTKIY